MSKGSNRAPKKQAVAPRVSASLLCELLRRQLPPPPSNTPPAAVVQFSVNLSLASVPLFHRIQTSKWVEKVIAARQVLDARHKELCALAPVNPLEPPADEEQQKLRLLQKVDDAICEYVAVDKTGLYEHPLITTRVALAQGFADDAFFERLARAIRQRIGWPGKVPRLVLSRADTMLDEGRSWQDTEKTFSKLWATDRETDTIPPCDKELYEALVKVWGTDPPKPEAFHKLLKRYGLTRRGGQKIKN